MEYRFWPPEKKKRFSEYQKKRKGAFKAKGICPNCEKNKAAPGRTCCVQCLEDKKLVGKFGTAAPYRQLYADLFEKQRGLCGICSTPMRRPILDHCHQSMIVRGLLCSNCNVGLGQFKDDVKLLSLAIRYLNENGGVDVIQKKNSD